MLVICATEKTSEGGLTKSSKFLADFRKIAMLPLRIFPSILQYNAEFKCRRKINLSSFYIKMPKRYEDDDIFMGYLFFPVIRP